MKLHIFLFLIFTSEIFSTEISSESTAELSSESTSELSSESTSELSSESTSEMENAVNETWPWSGTKDWWCHEHGNTIKKSLKKCKVNDRDACPEGTKCLVIQLKDIGFGDDEVGFCIPPESSEEIQNHYYFDELNEEQESSYKGIQHYMTKNFDTSHVTGMMFRHEMWTKRCLSTKNCYSYAAIDYKEKGLLNLHCGNFYKFSSSQMGAGAAVKRFFGFDTSEKFCAPDIKSEEKGFNLGDYCDEENPCYNGMTCNNHYCLLECTGIPEVCERFGGNVKCQKYSTEEKELDKFYCLDERYVINTHNAPFMTECEEKCPTEDFSCITQGTDPEHKKTFCTYPCKTDEDCNLYRSFVDPNYLECREMVNDEGVKQKYCLYKDIEQSFPETPERKANEKAYSQIHENDAPIVIPEWKPFDKPTEYLASLLTSGGISVPTAYFLSGFLDGFLFATADHDLVLGIFNTIKLFVQDTTKRGTFRRCLKGYRTNFQEKGTTIKKEEEEVEGSLADKAGKLLKEYKYERDIIEKGREEFNKKYGKEKEELTKEGHEKFLHKEFKKSFSEKSFPTEDDKVNKDMDEYVQLKCTALDLKEKTDLEAIDNEIQTETNKLSALEEEYDLTYRGDLIGAIKEKIGDSFIQSKQKKLSQIKQKINDRLTYLKYVKKCASRWRRFGHAVVSGVNKVLEMFKKLGEFVKNLFHYLIVRYMNPISCFCEMLKGLNINFCDQMSENFGFLIENLFYNLIESFLPTKDIQDKYGKIKDITLELISFIKFLVKGPINAQTFASNFGHFLGTIVKILLDKIKKYLSLGEFIKDKEDKPAGLIAVSFFV
ncbi:MAG: hypothetical protein MJ252_05275 [archaeon]|nr:hypothetical protein [archaeon]